MNNIKNLLYTTLLFAFVSIGQAQEIKRTELQRHDLETPGIEALQVSIEFGHGTEFGKHFHHGEEIIYVLEGTFEYEVEGSKPIILKAGEVLFVPAGVSHSARNIGKGKAVELATYVVEKGKPLVVMKK